MSASRWATVTGGVVGEPRPYAEREEGSVQIHDSVLRNDTTPDGGVTFYRDGVLVPDPGYPIPVGDLFKELSDVELASVLRLVFPAILDAQIGILVFLFRAVAQTELSSTDPRVVTARTAFGPLLGTDRITHLFRQR